MTNLEENKFASTNCQVVDDPSVHVLKTSPTLSQLTTATIELEDGSSVIKSEDASSFAMPFMH